MLHTPQRWKTIEGLFHEGLAMPEESRSGFLAERCGDDLELRNEVESLLSSAGAELQFLELPVIEAAHDLANGSRPILIAPGERIDRYEIISLIGAGGMGQVYLALDTRLNRRVAFKVLAPALAYDQYGLRRLEKEARAASALNHPNILTIYEFGHVDNLRFIVSEYVEGQTLRQKLDTGKLELSAAIDIAIQIAKALDAAHSFGIVHRDIKPENIVIRADNLVKVVDFGIAKLSDTPSHQGAYPQALALSVSISHAGMVIGSARYMSPEQARGQAVDQRSDIFSLGVVLYEMVCGKCPFDGETMSDVIAEILKGVPQTLRQILPNAPPELENLVNLAMRRDRECRYQNVKEMLAGLNAFASRLQFLDQYPGAALDQSAQSGALSTEGPSGSTQVSSTMTAVFRRLIGFRLAWLGIALLLVIVSMIGIFHAVEARKSQSPGMRAHPRTLAILPFRNLRQDAAIDYLGFSLADEMITELSAVNGLIVRPSSSVYQYRNQGVDPHKVGQDLDVDTLLTGGFIRDGDDLRITAQLVDLKPDRILWRDTIDVKFDKLLTVQDRVSHEIVKGMELSLSPAQAQNSSPTNPQAYEDYLRGVDLFSINDFPAAIAMLESSVSLDANYAPAWAHLGKAYAASATLQLGGREQYDKAQNAYEKAIALNPNLIEPRIYMANLLTDTGRVEQAVPLLRAALQISPDNAELHWELGYAYRFAGMLQGSVAECERARQIDPRVKINSSEINSYLYLGQYAKFLQSLPNSDSAYVLFYRGLGEYYLKNSSQAAQDFDRAFTLNPELLQAKIGRALGYAIAGRRDAGIELMRKTQNQIEDRGVGDAESMYKIAQAYAALGDKAAALHSLSHTVEGGFFCDSCFETDPLLADIRNESEFQRLSENARQRHERFKSRFF